jgi:hypothetical protein
MRTANCLRAGGTAGGVTPGVSQMPRQYTPRVDRVCEYCGAAFTELPCRIRQGRGRFCGHPCSYAGMRRDGPQPAPLADRVWARVDRLSAAPCWLWTGRLNSTGYGVIDTKDCPELAHRVVWRLVRGAIPDGLLLRHVGCRVRRCVNPDHTLPGTQAENMADMAADGTGKGKHGSERRRRQSGLFGSEP